MRNDLRDIAFAESRLPHRFKIGVGDLALVCDQLPRKRQRRRVFWRP